MVAIWGFIAVAAILVYFSLDLPDLSSLTATLRKPSITILADDNEQITAYGDVYGESLTLDQMPKYLPQAVLATEDRRFYSHFGVDPIGLARAMVTALVRGYDLALAQPAVGQRALESRVPGLNHALDTAELAGLGAAFRGPEGHFGVLDLALLRRWAAWETRCGIGKTPPDIAATFDTAFAPKG